MQQLTAQKANLEVLVGGGPFVVLVCHVWGRGYQPLVLDCDEKIVHIPEFEQEVYSSPEEAWQAMFHRTNMMVSQKNGKNQCEDERPRNPLPRGFDVPFEAPFPGATPGGLFDTRPHAHFGFESNSGPKRPSHVPGLSTGPLASGGLFGTTSGRGLFGNNTNVQGQSTGGMFGNNMNAQHWSTGTGQIPSTVGCKTTEPETFVSCFAAPRKSLFGSAPFKSEGTELGVSKGKAVSGSSTSKESADTTKASPKPTTSDSAPAAKKDAASSGGGSMDSVWATFAKLADHTSTVTEADNGIPGTIPDLSVVGAAMRAAAEQWASVPSVPGSMFAPKPTPSGTSVPVTTTTQQAFAPVSLFGSVSLSMFAPAPAPTPVDLGTAAPGLVSAPETNAPGSFAAPGSFGPSLFTSGAPSFAGASVRPAVVSVAEPEEQAVKDFPVETEKPVAEDQKPANDPSVQGPTGQKSAAEKKKEVKSGGIWDSKYAS